MELQTSLEASVLRIAAWSGPRNVSTALMRSFDSRSDTQVCDEPLYAHYLKVTGLPHPMAERIQAEHECDLDRVIEWLTGPANDEPRIFYQKHMAHHLLEGMPRDWIGSLKNVFLIRDPRGMLPSLLRIVPGSGLMDTGLPQQLELFTQETQRTGATPPVIDSADLLRDPEGMLKALCGALGIAFDTAMLNWPSGLRPTDGCWAEAWYGNALKSTGFAPYRETPAQLADEHMELLAECQELYEQLAPHRLRSVT
ncbi:MAG TPA: HAD family hydrolase [Planctomycetes bacterium]|nr:HAD family hydrolase [Planctomycetota bacterium]